MKILSRVLPSKAVKHKVQFDKYEINHASMNERKVTYDRANVDFRILQNLNMNTSALN